MEVEEFLKEWNSPSETMAVHTSGSTGTPKTMLVEKRRMLNSARITNDFLGLRRGDTALLCLPTEYIAGKMMVVRAIERGLRLVSVPPSGHPLADWRAQELHGLTRGLYGLAQGLPLHESLRKLTFAAMVPLQVYNSLQTDEERERLKSIKHLIIGGGAIDESLESTLRTFPNNVWSTYGMTETLSHIALRRINGKEASEWYTPLPSVKVGLSPEGCLVIDAPEVCAETLVTNDIAEFAPSHLSSQPSPLSSPLFRILGRRDNVICSGGIKIQAEELERTLRPHLSAPFLISRRKDDKFGEVVVLLTEGHPEESRMVCERVLPKVCRPKAYLHVDAIPMTQNGKPARREAAILAGGTP